MKKFFLTVTAILIAFNLIMPPHVAEASIATKPLTIAAKKAAKDVAKNTAVEMANQIVSEFLVKELLDGVKTDDGYSAVCMDGKKDNLKDCTPDKRAQIKTNLSANDKAKLADKVENVLEKKTLTSSKWGKFLDFFVPVFLISGAVSFISASMDGDILSFFDEIGQEALIESGLLKPLYLTLTENDYKWKDVSDIFTFVEITTTKPNPADVWLRLDFIVNPNSEFSITANGVNKKYTTRGYLQVAFVKGATMCTGDQCYPHSKINYFYHGSVISINRDLFRGGLMTREESSALADSFTNNFINSNFLTTSNSINDVVNTFISGASAFTPITINGRTLENPVPKTDYGNQTAIDKIKNPDGTVNIKGQDSFIFTYGDTHIYPSDDSKTGWKDKTTGEDITVVEDDIIVQDKTEGEDDIPPEEKPPSTDNGLPPDKDKNKQKLEDESKKLGNLVTTRFPFSLPWDFIAMIKLIYADPMTPKWEVRGTDKIPLNFDINLSFLDPYISWFRGFILIGFVISVIFMHGRFMGGSQ